MVSNPGKHYIGFDLGTSGARITIIKQNSSKPSHSRHVEVHTDSVLYSSYDDPDAWTKAIKTLLHNTPLDMLATTQSICVSGTSASCLLVASNSGKPSRIPKCKMYDYDITHERPDVDKLAQIKTRELMEKHVPLEHATLASTSALSKLLHYYYCKKLDNDEVLAHQSEYVANTIFLSNPGEKANTREYVSDWHNALKLGYDVRKLCYPSWLMNCLAEVGINSNVLPKVVSPGEVIGKITSSASKQFGIHANAVVVGGTTDSNAAFVAAAAASGSFPTYGTAVTSLGSTLAIKMLSRSYVENSTFGVYSHRFPTLGKRSGDKENVGEEAWLVGGASNVGCAILRQEQFSNDELLALSENMDVTTPSPFFYYPLTKRGERFPIADGSKEPILAPRPESRAEYLKGIFQGISLVERMGFQVLGELGCDPLFPDVVWTCGGGAKNNAWIQMRERLLEEGVGSIANVKVMKAENAEASYGAAVLAASSFV